MKKLDHQRLFTSLPGLFIVLSPQLEILEVSDAYAATAGKHKDEILNKPYFDFFPDESGELLKSLKEVWRTRKPSTIPTRALKDANGILRWWSSVNSPVFSARGEVEYIIRRVDDITDVIQQERKWQAVEKERDLFFSHSFDLMAIVGADGYFKRVNPATEKALGYTEEELKAQPISSFLHPDDVNKTKGGIQKLASGDKRIASVNRYRCKSGEYRYFSWNTTPLGDRFYSVGRDITEQVAAEERIRELNNALERKNEDLEIKIQERLKELRDKEGQLQQLQKLDAIGRLAGGIAHDFNNILGAIQMYCDLIFNKAENIKAVKDSIRQVEKATDRGAALTRQLLIFSRKKVVETQAIMLNDLLKDHFKMLDRLIGENIEVEFRLNQDVPLISADPGQIEQIIMNLTINARDAMPSGGKIVIETRYENLTEQFASSHLASKLGPHVLLSVTDTGCGMDEKTRLQIFEPFFTTKAVGQGTGLGLSTVYGIVKSLEGTIWVYSEPGKGTVFKIYIPASEVAEEKVVHTVQPRNLVGQERILVVEDDENLRGLYEGALRSYGYQVHIAENGKRALEILRQQPDIEMIVTDMIMPEIGGTQLVETVLAQNPNMKILCMSGYPGENSDVQIFESANVGYLQKPFNTTTLVTRIRELLEAAATPHAS